VTERSLFENALLGLLCDGPAHGYDLALRFGPGGDLGAVGFVGKSQVYALLKHLEARGLAASHLEEGSGGPARRVYEATPAGRERFLAWAREPVGSVRGLRVEFPLKLYLVERLGLPFRAELLRRQEDLLRERLAEVRARGRGARGVGLWVRDLRERLLEAGLAWLAERRAGGQSGGEAR